MIVPTLKDCVAIDSFKGLSLDKIDKNSLLNCLSGICKARGEQPFSIKIRKKSIPNLNLISRSIILPSENDLIVFFHEVGHLISLLDRGNPGSDIEAESFAFGVYFYLFPEEMGFISNVHYTKIKEEPMRTILWTESFLRKLHVVW